MILAAWFRKGRLKRALELLNSGLLEEAAAEFRSLHDERGGGEAAGGPGARFYLAECCLALGDREAAAGRAEAALVHYGEAAALGVTYPDLWFRTAEAALALGRLDQASEAVDKALEGNPDYVRARLLRARIRRAQGRIQEAVDEYRSLESKESLYDPVLFGRGMERVAAGAEAEGLALLEASFAERPDRVKAAYLKAVRHHQARDYEAAAREVRAILEDHPDYPDLHNFLGVACSGLGALEEAAAAFARALEIHPGYIEARLNLALTRERMGDRPRAEEAYREVLRREPGNELAAEGLERLTRGRTP